MTGTVKSRKSNLRDWVFIPDIRSVAEVRLVRQTWLLNVKFGDHLYQINILHV